MRAPQPDWMLRLKVVDLLVKGNGKPRAVRSLYRYPNGDLAGITFAIRACSWTGRCYTAISYNDLKQTGYVPYINGNTKVRMKLNSDMDKKIAGCIRNGEDRSLGCCDVKGSF